MPIAVERQSDGPSSYSPAPLPSKKLDILANVWDFDFDGDPNIVEVYIRRVRQKIDEPFGRHAIVTIRGAGYRLATDGG